MTGLQIWFAPRSRVISFGPNDIGTLADARGVAVRTGHHCAQTVMTRFDVPATARASFGVYNSREDLDALVEALHAVNRIFA